MKESCRVDAEIVQHPALDNGVELTASMTGQQSLPFERPQVHGHADAGEPCLGELCDIDSNRVLVVRHQREAERCA